MRHGESSCPALVLRAGDREELEGWVRSRSVSAGLCLDPATSLRRVRCHASPDPRVLDPSASIIQISFGEFLNLR